METDSQLSEAILMVAHGSRRKEANDDLYRLADMVKAARPEKLVECAFLDVVEPTIPQGAEACVNQGADRVLIFPYFLSAGRHVVDDLNQFQTEFAFRWPDVHFQICPHLGLHPLMVQIVFDRLAAAEQHSPNS